MEEQLVRILQNTQSSLSSVREDAEKQLDGLYSTPGYGVALASVASHDSVAPDIRLAALIALRQLIVRGWSPEFDEYLGQELFRPEDKARLRQVLLELSMGLTEDRKIKKSASFALSKVAFADFPDEWPDLLPTILRVIQTGNDNQLDGALRVLNDLVDDSLSDTQFFDSARDVIQSAYTVAADKSKPLFVRALAVKVFKGSIASMEQLMMTYKEEVEKFAGEMLSTWLPLFLEIMQTNLSEALSRQSDGQDSSAAEAARGLIALKAQVLPTLMRIRSVFPSKLAPQSPALFSAVWEELSLTQATYYQLFIADQTDGRSSNDDGLPYTLDLLVIEELDFIQACLRASAVKKLLESHLQGDWVTDVMKLIISYAQITSEDEGMWNIDVNVFLTEETSVTANYTPRSACGELAIKLAEWLPSKAIIGLLTYARSLFATEPEHDWRKKEAALYILNQLTTSESELLTAAIRDEAAKSIDLIRHAVGHKNIFLRARGYSLAGTLTKTSTDDSAQYGVTLREVALQFMQLTLQAINHDSSELVQVTCVRALQFYLQSISEKVLKPHQATLIAALSEFVSSKDLNEITESEVRAFYFVKIWDDECHYNKMTNKGEDIFASLLETLRDAIRLDSTICLNGTGLDDLFTIASQAADSFNVISVVNEIFENITISISALGDEPYDQLCERVLPSLTGAFDVAALAEWSSLTGVAAGEFDILLLRLHDLAIHANEKEDRSFDEYLNYWLIERHIDLLNILIENGPERLPKGFVAATMPKLKRLLLDWTDEELVKSATSAVKNILVHDYAQLFEWHDEDGKGGLENVLIIIDRLLKVEDNAAAQVGGLAAELVEKAGPQRLGPFLPQLLSAVAVRLGTAEQAQIIQSLILVFARLSGQEQTAKEVIDFLAQVRVGEQSGLEVVMSKWLENSVNFAGYDEIRQNVIALSKLYDLDDPRLAQIQVKGDFIFDPKDSRIVTRSRTRGGELVEFHDRSWGSPTFGKWIPADQVQDPTRFTIVSATLKIVKVLIAELQAAGDDAGALSQDVIAQLEEARDDDDEWEDDPDTLDLASPGVQQGNFLSSFVGNYSGDPANFEQALFGALENNREPDDETQTYLINFFQNAATRPNFPFYFSQLTPEEQMKLRSLINLNI